MAFASHHSCAYVSQMPGQGQQSSLQISNLACVRGGRMLFKGLSLSLSAGEAAFVSGPNGVGKSSLLRLLAGLLTPYAGDIAVTGRIALADQELALDTPLPLTKALSFWARLDGGTTGPALKAMAMDHLANVPVRILSTGQRKRAVIARTIASGADIWLLDEPGNGLDTASLDRLNTAMAAHRETGGIIVAASHQPLDLPGAQSVEIEPPQ
jgi:heme exporter protein A